MSDTLHTIFKSAKHFLSGTILSRFSGLVRDVTMACAFGTHAAVAAFFVAFRLSHLLRRLFGEGALQTSFTPHYEKLKREDPLRACYFFRDLVFHLSLFLFLLIAGIFSVVKGSELLWVSEENKMIIHLSLIMLPSLLFICLFGLNAAFLQCEKKYFIPGIAPVSFNLVWIIGVCVLWATPVEEAMFLLGGILNIACFAQWLTTVPKTKTLLREKGLTNLGLNFSLFSSDLQFFLKPLLLGIIGVGASQINNALDAIFARYASPEGPAYLWYAIRMQQLPLSLIGIAIAGALLPPLTRAIKALDPAKSFHFLNFAIKKCLSCMIPITIALFALGEQGIRVLYGRGDFDQESILYTTQCLIGYSFGLIPMALVLVLAPAFYAQDDYRLPTQASLIAMTLNGILNYLAVVVFGCPAVGIAWMTSVASWVNLWILWSALKKRLGRFIQETWWSASGKILISSLSGWIFMLGLTQGIFQVPSTFLENVLQLFVCSSVYCAFTFTIAWVIGAKDLLHIFQVRETQAS